MMLSDVVERNVLLHDGYFHPFESCCTPQSEVRHLFTETWIAFSITFQVAQPYSTDGKFDLKKWDFKFLASCVEIKVWGAFLNAISTRISSCNCMLSVPHSSSPIHCNWTLISTYIKITSKTYLMVISIKKVCKHEVCSAATLMPWRMIILLM